MAMEKVTNEIVWERLKRIGELNMKYPENSINRIISYKVIGFDIEKKTADFEAVIPSGVENKLGSVHGGYVVALTDELMCITAFLLAIDVNTLATTLDMSFTCLKPLHEGDKLDVHVEVKHAGKRSISVACEMYKDGVLCTCGSENLIVCGEHAFEF